MWDPKNYSEQVLYAIYYYTLIPVSPGQYVNMTLAVTSSNNPYAVFNGQKYNFPLTFVLSSSDVVQLTPLGSFSIRSSNSLVPSFAIEGNYYNLPSSLFVSASIYNR
ncbi:hypothetical protein V6M85_12385 [Sulfolobus tengchongensis]|uniref:Uncharacterized protein n=1 Tax=Sulfolobus tengchongensis TaxID=207809 RepID=A0AAX4L046_9CREN